MAPTPEAVLNSLRGHGLRVSTARRLVVQALFAAEGPVTAEEGAGGLDGVPQLDLASVYRNLDTFEELGIVQALQAGRQPRRYLLAGERPRDYLCCRNCGAVEEIDPAETAVLCSELLRRHGFVLEPG